MHVNGMVSLVSAGEFDADLVALLSYRLREEWQAIEFDENDGFAC